VQSVPARIIVSQHDIVLVSVVLGVQ